MNQATKTKLHALKQLQHMRSDLAAMRYAKFEENLAATGREIGKLRGLGPVLDARVPNPKSIGNQWLWREQRINALNLKMALLRSELETVRSTYKREFGRKTALDKLNDQDR